MENRNIMDSFHRFYFCINAVKGGTTLTGVKTVCTNRKPINVPNLSIYLSIDLSLWRSKGRPAKQGFAYVITFNVK